MGGAQEANYRRIPPKKIPRENRNAQGQYESGRRTNPGTIGGNIGIIIEKLATAIWAMLRSRHVTGKNCKKILCSVLHFHPNFSKDL